MKIRTNILILILLCFSFQNTTAQKRLTAIDTTSSIKLKEVTIQAEKTDQRLQKAPVSASVVSAMTIKDAGIESLTGVSMIVPNLYMPDYGTRLTSPVYIRGIGSRINSPSVGLYVDNIPYMDKGSFNFNFVGIQKIEVLRGPQGTLYGRNTLGGLIKVYTQDPEPVTAAGAYLEYGNAKYLNSHLYFSTPLSKTLSLRGDGGLLHQGGFFTNQYDGTKVDHTETYTGRLKLKYHPSGRLMVLYSADFEKNNQGGYPFALYNDSSKTAGDVNYNQASSYNRDLFSSGLYIKYSARKFKINFSASYQLLDDLQKVDQDFTPRSLFFVTQDRQNHNIAQEFTLHSLNSSRITWLVGIFSFQQLSHRNVGVDFGSDAAMFHIDHKKKTYDSPVYGTALYAQASLPLGKFTVTGGIRLDHENDRLTYHYDLILLTGDTINSSFDHRLDFDQWLPRISFTYLPASNITLYATVAKGYKSGGFNTTFEREEDETYLPETTVNYEAGFKSSFFKHRLTANVSLFYIDWRHQQVYQPVPSGHGAMLKNAGHSQSKGMEIELQALPLKRLIMYMNTGFTKARFLKYEKDSLHIYDGKYIPYVPDYTISLGCTYTWIFPHASLEELSMNAEYMRTGRIFWNESNSASQKGYGLLNMRIGISSHHFQWGLWARNLLNESYATFYFESLGNAYVQKGNPLQAGVFLSYNL